jgi:hypothetical protein
MVMKSLPPIQHHVIIAIWLGSSISEAARACGVDRSTIHRWMREDARFIAALNQTVESERQEFETRISSMAARGLDKLDKALYAGDLGAAKFCAGLMFKIPRRQQNPRVIAKRIRRRKQREQEYLATPDTPPKAPVITSSIPTPPPPAQLPEGRAGESGTVDNAAPQPASQLPPSAFTLPPSPLNSPPTTHNTLAAPPPAPGTAD